MVMEESKLTDNGKQVEQLQQLQQSFYVMS